MAEVTPCLLDSTQAAFVGGQEGTGEDREGTLMIGHSGDRPGTAGHGGA